MSAAVVTMGNAVFQAAYRHLLRRLRLRRGLDALAIAAAASAIAVLAGATPAVSMIFLAASLLLSFAGLGLLPAYRGATPADFTKHLDRRFPQLEESSRLALADETQLEPLQRLQQSRVVAALPGALDAQPEWLPPAVHRPAVFTIIAASILVVFAVPIRDAVSFGAEQVAAQSDSAISEDDLFRSLEVRIAPPAYTKLPETVSADLDLELAEGSLVSWSFQFQRQGQYALVIADEPPMPILPGADGRHTATRQIEQTSLYRIVDLDGDPEQALAGIHTLTVLLDAPPRVRILEPGESAVEIDRDGNPRFDSRVVVRDDFGVGPVEIRASVAKGSGEGVKFRDEVFQFDGTVEDAPNDSAQRTYSRAWNLETLGMEPGDEVYFFVVAADNRSPEPNVARSDTIVVRWLDEAPEVVTVGDIAIDVMPEYFKSQRQIIIETEQLIADRDVLDPASFENTSRALGDAQAELKNRYGQYLGDEFGETLDGDFTAEAMAAMERDDDDGDHGEHEDHDEHGDRDEHEDHDQHGDEVVQELAPGHYHGDGHDHGEAPLQALPGSGAALIARFTHTHEVSDIGPVSDRNPVGLMKRAVAEMWQSELRLRLGDPDKALPHQYDALDYYNRAREADRIFTRRLGFEPPPVSEDRRLTGDTSDVRDNRLDESRSSSDSDKALFREVYWRLSQRVPAEPFSADEKDLLGRAASRLQALSSERPALIQQAATFERLQAAGSAANEDCDDCLVDAMRAAWSVLSSAYARPQPGSRELDPDDSLTRDYAGLVTGRD